MKYSRPNVILCSCVRPNRSYISILAAVSLIHITSAVRKIKSSFLFCYTHLLKSKFSPAFVEFVIRFESSDRRPFALRSRMHHVTVSFSFPRQFEKRVVVQGPADRSVNVTAARRRVYAASMCLFLGSTVNVCMNGSMLIRL